MSIQPRLEVSRARAAAREYLSKTSYAVLDDALPDRTTRGAQLSMSHKNKCAIYWYCAFLERQTVERIL
jgi:hypothetical protein